MWLPNGPGVNSYTNVSPGLMGGCVMNGTPSIAFGTRCPCQCTDVLCSISFFTMTRTGSPSTTRISGPGTMPL